MYIRPDPIIWFSPLIITIVVVSFTSQTAGPQRAFPTDVTLRHHQFRPPVAPTSEVQLRKCLADPQSKREKDQSRSLPTTKCQRSYIIPASVFSNATPSPRAEAVQRDGKVKTFDSRDRGVGKRRSKSSARESRVFSFPFSQRFLDYFTFLQAAYDATVVWNWLRKFRVCKLNSGSFIKINNKN